MRPYVIISLSMLCLFVTGCNRGKKNDYTSETYYERVSRWYWSDKYEQTIVAVPIDDRVEPAFVVSRVLYEKEGDKYVERKVKTVNLEVYEAADQRRQKILDNLFNAFRLMILVGGAGMFIGILLFALKFKFPHIPSIWDEFLIYGGVIICIGMFGAWYVEQFILVCIGGGAAIVVFAGYSLYKHTKMELKHKDTAIAVDEIVTSMEVLKLEIGEKAWTKVRNKLIQNEKTKSLVDTLQEAAKKKAEALHALS